MGVFAATLGPSSGPTREPTWILLDPLPLADVFRNVGLFLPIGLAAAGLGASWRLALGSGLLLSLAIEAAQLWLPGRHTTFLDVLANGGGVALGHTLMARTASWWVPDRVTSRKLLAGVTGAGVAVLALAGSLATPSPRSDELFVHQHFDLPQLAPYDGRVRSVLLDGAPLLEGWPTDPADLQRRLAGDFSLRLEVVVGAPPSGQSAFLLLTALQEEVLLLGPDGTDLVFRWRSRAQDWGLDGTRLRLPRALADVPVGASLRLEVERRGADLCLTVDESVLCQLGVTLGDGWARVVPELRPLDRHRSGMALLWVALLAFPLGYWGARAPRAGLLAVVVGGVALWGLPAALGLQPTPASQWLGGVAGALAGVAVAAVIRRIVWPGPADNAV